MELDLESAVHEWMLEEPRSLRVFEEFGIDTSCGGKSLEYACRERGVDPRAVLARLREVMGRDAGE